MISPNSATQTTLMLIIPNSLRINRTGEIVTRLISGGPAKPTNKKDENKILQASGQIETVGKLAMTRLPKIRIKISWTPNPMTAPMTAASKPRLINIFI